MTATRTVVIMKDGGKEGARRVTEITVEMCTHRWRSNRQVTTMASVPQWWGWFHHFGYDDGEKIEKYSHKNRKNKNPI